MRQNIGGLAGFLAVVGLLIHTQSPPSAEKSENRTPAASRAKAKPPAAEETTDKPEGPWIATQAFFPPGAGEFDPAGLTQHSLNDAESEKLQRFLGLPRQKMEMWSIVATVADPEHTRLSLFLDSQLESIERAFQAAGWDFAGQWLPWVDEVDATEKDINERRKQRRMQRDQENYPGVLIFRSAPDETSNTFPARALFVLVVPETPTTGVNGPAFFAAMNIAYAIKRASIKEGHPIGLLAPSFTGSFSSLADLLMDWEKANPPNLVYGKVYGGSISGYHYAHSFMNTTHHEFYSGIVDSVEYQTAFENVLKRYRIDMSHAAILRENATGFSRGFTTSQQATSQKVPVFVFPRDIAHLRNSYQDVRGGAGQSDPEHTPGIDFSLKDPEGGEDSIPIFSNIQTPLSQNSIVDSITTEFRRNRTHIVFIAATNTLDALFLTQLVRRNSPETRVLVSNPNVLFVAAAAREGLTGTLFLSTYPMFLKGAEWLNPSDEDRIKFAGPDFQGMFNVGQLLASDLQANFSTMDQGNPHLRGYRHLKTDAAYPGLWLLTLTRTGFLPLDFPEPNMPQGLFAPNPVADEHQSRILPDDPPPSSWYITALLTTVAIFICCVLLLACNVFGWLERPRWLVMTDHFKTRLMAILGASLSISALMWVLAFPVWRATLKWSAFEQGSNILAAVVTFLAFLAPLLSLLWVVLVRRKAMSFELAHQHRSMRWRLQGSIYTGTAITLFLVVTVAWAWTCSETSNAAFFFRFRALDLFSGASPAAPFAVLTIAFFGISLIYFKRYTDAGKMRPRLPQARRSKWPEMHETNRLGTEIENSIMAPAQLPVHQWRVRLAVCGFFVCICAMVLVLGRRFYAFEVWQYNWAIYIALVVLLFCLATGCYDLVRIWTNLARLIDRIDLLSLDSALDRVSAEWSPQPVWAFGRSVSREALTRQMLDELRMRQEALRAQEVHSHQFSFRRSRTVVTHTTAKIAGLQRKRLSERALARLDGSKRTDHLTNRRDFETFSAGLAAIILVRDLQPDWGAIETGPENGKKEFEDFLDHSRGFVMLQLSRFLIYVVQQARRVALCISLDLLMLILFFHSYTSQSPTLVSQFLAVLFVAVGVILFQVFAGMERNRTLSRIARTNPGELGGAFWLHLAALGGLPFLGLLAHLFPPISNFLFSWVAPNLQSTR